jgi:SAM-dependent methyltransferase
MLAPKSLPENFAAWNQKYKAPDGASWWVNFVNSEIRGHNFAWRNRMKLPVWIIQQIGAFGFQLNSATRTFEYPWCFFVTPLEPGMRVVEIGAGAAGFQFVLANCGLDVTSVDPLINPTEKVEWIFGNQEFNHLNNAFGGKVKFIREFLENAKLTSNYYDRVFAISAIEHIPQEAIAPLVKEIERILKPGGLFVATIDLFLDCYPFTNKASNKYGTNISVCDLIEQSGLQLKVGNPAQLYGYPEFEPENIRHNLSEFLVANNVLTQCIVLEKSA